MVRLALATTLILALATPSVGAPVTVRWEFSDAASSSPSGFDGVLTSDAGTLPTFVDVAGEPGNRAITLDASATQFVAFPEVAFDHLARLEVRVRTTGAGQSIIDGGPTFFDWRIGVDADGHAFYAHFTNGPNDYVVLTSTVVVNDGQYHTIEALADQDTDTIQLTVDGSDVTTYTEVRGNNSWASSAPGQSKLGKSDTQDFASSLPLGPGTHYFTGEVDYLELLVEPTVPDPSFAWSFDDGNDPSAASFGGVSAALVGPVFAAGAPIGRAGNQSLLFDGANDYVEVAHAAGLNPTFGQPFTISAWVNPAVTDQQMAVVHKGTTFGSNEEQWRVTVEAQGTQIAGASGNRMVEFVYSTPTQVDQFFSVQGLGDFASINGWYHVAVSVTEIGGDAAAHTFYINGHPIAAVANTDVVTGVMTTTEPLNIGGGLSGTGLLWDGRLDEVAIWNGAALTTQQIAALSASSTVIFSEDFESYAAGSNLNGQGGWAVTNGAGVIVNPRAEFQGSQVADAFTDVGGDQMSIKQHGITLDPVLIHTLTFRSFASTTNPRSHNAGLTFGTPTNPFFAGWFEFNNNGPQRWVFFSPNEAAVDLPTGFGFDDVVKLTTVLDPIRGEVFGKIETADGTVQDTPRLTLTPADVAEINHLNMNQEYEQAPTRMGVLIDDILVVSEEPPPNQLPDCSGATIAQQSADANCEVTISGLDVTGVTDPMGIR